MKRRAPVFVPHEETPEEMFGRTRSDWWRIIIESTTEDQYLLTVLGRVPGWDRSEEILRKLRAIGVSAIVQRVPIPVEEEISICRILCVRKGWEIRLEVLFVDSPRNPLDDLDPPHPMIRTGLAEVAVHVFRTPEDWEPWNLGRHVPDIFGSDGFGRVEAITAIGTAGHTGITDARRTVSPPRLGWCGLAEEPLVEITIRLRGSNLTRFVLSRDSEADEKIIEVSGYEILTRRNVYPGEPIWVRLRQMGDLIEGGKVRLGEDL